MDIGNLFWIILLASAFYPMVQQRMLEAARLRLFARMEKERGSRVITLIHRQERFSLLGVPLMRFIDIEDSESVLRAIRMTPDDMPIDIILHTPGGMVLAAGQIAHALRRHPAPVTAFIPHYAMSGGTLIALAADQIVMDADAVLGPVDPQLGNMPAVSILKVLEQKPASEIDDQTLILADMSRKAINQVRSCLVDHLMAQEHAKEAASDPEAMEARRKQAIEIATALTDGRWTHDHPITVEEARALGLNISTDLPDIVHELMDLYPQPPTGRPSVEYVPLPYQHPAPRPPASGTRGDK
jgi:ClpP class serine protease